MTSPSLVGEYVIYSEKSRSILVCYTLADMSKSLHHEVKSESASYPRLVFIHTPNLPFSIVSFWLRAGSRFEPKSKAGLAHFLEHISLKRTKRFPNVSERMRYIQERGILYGAFTSQDPVWYYTTQEPKRTLEGYEILRDGFSNSLINAEDIEAEKEPVIDELKKTERDPSKVLWYVANSGIWPNSSLSHNPLGTENTVHSIKRRDIIDFQRKYYLNSNLTVLVISPDKNNYKQIRKRVGQLRESSRINIRSEKFAGPRNIVLREKSSNFVQIAVSFRTFGNKTGKEVAALRLITGYLAGGWISRFNQKLRIEKNVTYHVESFVRDFPDTGVVRFIFSTRKKNLKETLMIVKEEIDILKNQKISEDQLQVHKNSLRIGILSHSLTRESLLRFYGWSSIAYDYPPVPLQKFAEDIDKVSPETIKRVANKHLATVSVVGIGDINEDDLQL